MSEGWDDLVLVGRIVKPHGLRGHVVVNPETDFVEERFQVGAEFISRPARGEEHLDERLVITASRLQNGRPVVTFAGHETRELAEALAGRELRVREESLLPLAAGSYYHHQLIGCTVEDASGARVGEVARVDGGAAGALLAVDGAHGEILIPLADAICLEIDPAARRIRVQLPEGLLELNETRRGPR